LKKRVYSSRLRNDRGGGAQTRRTRGPEYRRIDCAPVGRSAPEKRRCQYYYGTAIRLYIPTRSRFMNPNTNKHVVGYSVVVGNRRER